MRKDRIHEGRGYLPLYTMPFVLFPKLLDFLKLLCAMDQRQG